MNRFCISSVCRSASLIVACVVACMLVASHASAAAPSTKPNFVLNLGDDHGYGDVSTYHASDVRTPHLDRLAADGMRFTTMRANCTVCSPSRAALLTGKFPDRVGVPGVIRTQPENSWGYFDPSMPTLADELKKVGYHSAIVGKWHLGLESPNTPNERGFDFFQGFLGDLAGVDPRTGRDFSHRKNWLHDRIAVLMSIFAVEALEISILDNHLHLVLRNRPDIVALWSDEEVVRRWLRLHRQLLYLLVPASDETVREFMKNKQRLLAIRLRLSSISWFMAYLKEPISRAANDEDDATGAFWASRFWCELLPDPKSRLACCIYVNLNPIRAGIAAKLEDAKFTSMYDRILDLLSGDPNRPHSGWLSPVHIDGDGYAGAAAQRRASDMGYLDVTFEQYLELLDSIIRREAAERAGGMLQEYPPILERLGITSADWETSVRRMSARFARELEKSQKLLDEMRDRRQGPKQD